MNPHCPLFPGTLLPGRLLGSPGSGTPAKPARLQYRLGDPGRPATMPTLLIAVFDDSGSVTGQGGTDPLSNRYAEVTRAFSVVARKGSRHELGAIIHFDTPSDRDIAPTPITRTGRLRLRRGLRPPADAAGTSELAPSLERAVAIAQAYPDHAATLVVLSDFLIMDADPGQVLDELANFPGAVHAAVLGVRLPAGVLDERITITPIDHSSPPGAVARVLFTSLITHRPGSHVATGL